MSKSYSFELVNDIGIDIPCEVKINGKECVQEKREHSTIYSIFSIDEEQIEISITKYNIWRDFNKGTKIIFFFWALFNFIISSGVEDSSFMNSKNMPIQIDYKEIIYNKESSFDKKVSLRNIVKVEEISFVKWRYHLLIEECGFIIFLLMLELLIGFVIGGHYKWLILFCSAMIDIILIVSYKYHNKKIFNILYLLKK